MCISRLVKFIFACSLSLLLTFSCFVYPTFAQSTSFEYVEECFDNFDDPMFFPESETSGDAFSFFGLLPEISEEREVNWIDRIHNKPQYAVDFYDWLVENETLNGSLVSAHEETVVGDNKSSYQVHKIVSYSDTVYVDLKTGMTSKEALNLLYAKRDELFSDRVDDDFYTCAEWISEVYSAFDRDHPEAFWLSGGTIVSHKTKYTYGYDLANNIGLVKYVQNIYFRLHDDDFDIRSTAYCSHSNSNVTTVCSSACDLINNSIIEMNNAINKIISGCNATSDVEKVKYFNKYLTENNCYNQYADTNIYSPLAHRSISAITKTYGIYDPVCDGYARAFKVLCDRSGIPCVLVDGISDGDAHMWNYVEIDGVWYAVDVTWNDPLTSVNNNISGYENDKYLLVGSESVIDGRKFSDTHIVRNTVVDGGISFFNEPLLSKSTYNSNVNHLCTIKNDYCTFCYAKRYDVNRDTEVDMIDVISLRNSLLDIDVLRNSDCDLSGSVNSLDFVELKKYFWQVF